MMRIQSRLTHTLLLLTIVTHRSTFGEDNAPAKPQPQAQTVNDSDASPPVFKEREPAEQKAQKAEQAREARHVPAGQGVVVEELDVNVVQPARRVGRVIRPAGGMVANEAIAQRNLARIRPILNSELRLVRLICEDLTMEQRAKIRSEIETQLKELVKESKPQRKVNGGTTPFPASAVRNALALLVKREVSAECATMYQEEVDHRIALRKQASIMTVVSRIDAILLLSPEQCDAITSAVKSNWQDDWETWITYPPEIFPQPIDQYVVPHLTEAQAEIWMLQQKAFYERGERAVNGNDDGWWGVDTEVEKPVEEPVRVKMIRRAL